MEISTSEIIDIISDIFLLIGSFLIITSAIGLIRMKDFFTRTHAAGINDSLSLAVILIGVLLKLEPSLVMAKLIIIIAFSMITASTAAHALTKAAIYDIEPDGEKDSSLKHKLKNNEN